MSNPYGWGQNEPQIKPKDQGGDTIATFSQKVYNLFNNLFDTLNSYPWSAATQSDAGYMSAADKVALDGVPTMYLPTSTISTGTWTPELIGNTTPGTYTYKQQNGTYIKIGNLVYITADIEIGAYTVHPYGRAYITGLPFVVYSDLTAINLRGSSGLSNSFNKCTRAVTGNGYTRIFLQGIDQSNNLIDDLTFSNSSQTGGRYLSLATPSGTNTTGHIILSGCYRSQ